LEERQKKAARFDYFLRGTSDRSQTCGFLNPIVVGNVLASFIAHLLVPSSNQTREYRYLLRGKTNTAEIFGIQSTKKDNKDAQKQRKKRNKKSSQK
jgi:Uncharacterized conserved protein